MWLCGRDGGKKSGSVRGLQRGEQSYSPLLEAQLSRPDGEASPSPDASTRQQEKEIVLKWLMNCSTEDGAEVLNELHKQRPDIIRLDEKDHGCRQSMTLKHTEIIHVGQESAMPTTPIPTPRLEGAALSMLQFSAPKYFCIENENAVELEVLRLTNMDLHCKVQYKTVGSSAQPHVNYVPVEGVLEFLPGDVQKVIQVSLIDDTSWAGVLEFRVELIENSTENCWFNEQNRMARVQRIDDDVFPSNKYAAQIRAGDFDHMSSSWLFWEYFKLNLQDVKLRRGTIKLILLGQFMNIMNLMRFVASIYLVDHVLVRDTTSEGLGPKSELMIYIGMGLVLTLMLHLASVRKFSWGVAGNARMNLSMGLANAFLHIDQGAAGQVNEALLHEAMTHDTDTLIKVGFSSFLTLFQLFGEIAMCIIFQMSAILSNSDAGVMVVWLVTAFPLVMVGVIGLRMKSTRIALQKRRDADQELANHVHEMVSKVALVRDYHLKGWAMDRHAEDVSSVNKSDRELAEVLEHNKYFIRWLSILAISCFTFFAGLQVIGGSMKLGVFLTCVKVFGTLSTKWAAVYTEVLQTFGSTSSLERIIRFVNVPTDADQHMLWSRSQLKLTIAEAHKGVGKEGKDGKRKDVFSTIPIRLQNLTVELKTHDGHNKDEWDMETRLYYDQMTIKQGQFVCLIGAPGEGKTTLLKLLGSAQLPSMVGGLDKCTWFIPSHLRVLHVRREPIFIRGNLYQNLTYGLHEGHPSGRLERVQAICRKLGVPEVTIKRIHPDAPVNGRWTVSLSHSVLVLLAIARALITDPDVLCIHKPTAQVNFSTAQKVIDALREYVDRRGLAMEPDDDTTSYKNRRPRTCIMTSTRAHSLEVADAIYKVSRQGVHLVDLDKEDVNLEDMC